MKLLANENIEKGIILFFRDLGYDIKYCSEIRPRLTDGEVVKLANKEKRIILTIVVSENKVRIRPLNIVR